MLRSIGILFVALWLSACAAGSSVQSISGAPQINSTLGGAVDVYSSVPDTSGNAAALRSALVAQLQAKKVFKAITDPDSADYLVRVNVTQISEVGQGARIMLGALAGQASVVANCEVFDRKQNAVIGNMVAQGKSSGGHIFAGTTQEAIDLTARQISDFLLQNRLM
jgi:hypothetical protein